MSTPFLERFSRTVVERLVARGQLILVPGGEADVVDHLADHLAAAGGSLITALAEGLVTADAVDELFADDEDLKQLVDDLDRQDAGL